MHRRNQGGFSGFSVCMQISTKRLQQLLAVATYGSFSKAAMEMNISQPALSRNIAQMEERYGFPIFNRLNNGVELTAAGAQVIVQAQQLLRHMNAFDCNLKLIGTGEAGELSIGITPLLASQLLARFASDFFNHDSQAQLKVTVRSGDELLTSLMTGKVEFILFPETYLEPSPDLVIRPIGKFDSIFVVRKGHPLSGRGAVTLEEVSTFPWAGSIAPPSIPNPISRALFLCDNYHIMRDTLLTTNLVCVCSTAFVAQDLANGLLQEVTVLDSPLDTMRIYMASLRGQEHSPLAHAAIQRIKHYLSSHTQEL